MNSLLEGPSLASALGLMALALIPLALVTLTSFAKISVVFSALRNALGAQDIPSSSILTALSFALSLFVMAPILDHITLKSAPNAALDMAAMVESVREPMRSFLVRNAGKGETELFVSLSKERGESLDATDFRVLWASFAITELKRAFQLAFFVFLPFLILDLVVAQLLLALGLHGLTPSAVALPFKLLLFVSADGFALISRALVLGYNWS